MTDPEPTGGGMIGAVLFDFGGVLAEDGFRDGLRAMAVEQGLDPENLHREGLLAVYDSGFVLGRGSAGRFWTLLRQRAGLRGDDVELSRRILDGFVIRPWMMERARGLHARGYLTAILSDHTHWLDTLDERYRFSRVFDRLYNSYYLGKGKRDPSLFDDVVVDLERVPDSILFVDDDAGNVERARAAGLQAIQYVDCRRFLEALEQALGDTSATAGQRLGSKR